MSYLPLATVSWVALQHTASQHFCGLYISLKSINKVRAKNGSVDGNNVSAAFTIGTAIQRSQQCLLLFHPYSYLPSNIWVQHCGTFLIHRGPLNKMKNLGECLSDLEFS